MKKGFGLSDGVANTLAAVIQTEIKSGITAGLVGGYDKAIKYIENKANEIGVSLHPNVYSKDAVNSFRELVSINAQMEYETKAFENTLKSVMGTTTIYGLKIKELEEAYEKRKRVYP